MRSPWRCAGGSRVASVTTIHQYITDSPDQNSTM